jgi:uncharacterized protein YprB with RNaseH-like and TPR domain
MPDLSDRLRSLGVKVGARDLPPPSPKTRPDQTLQEVLAGRPLETHFGETFLVEASYPPEYRHGRCGLQTAAPLQAMAAWAQEARICECTPETFAFLDTETTGLNGGSGTYAFLIGVGRFDGSGFRLAQFFMRDPIEEPAQLAALEEFLAPCQALVTFNGKAFDVPLLNARFITHGWRPPFFDSAHVDLLHLARRLWRDRLPSRTLGSLEVNILGTRRTGEDVPGWMIPQMYFDYLRSGDPTPLKSVFYHNAMDVLSLASLFTYTAELLADPFDGKVEHAVDWISLGRLFEDLGDQEAARRLYRLGLEHDLPAEFLPDAIHRLAMMHKREEDLLAAVDLWQKAASHQNLQAHIELAKVFEHRLRDPAQALEWTQSAIATVKSSRLSAYERRQWLDQLEHRRARLQRKVPNPSPEPGCDDE